MAQSQKTSMTLFFYPRNSKAHRIWHVFLRGSQETGSEFASGRMVARLEESDLFLLKAKLEPFLCLAIPSGSDSYVMVKRTWRPCMAFFLSHKLRLLLAPFRDRIIQHVLETTYLYGYRRKLDLSSTTRISINHPLLLDVPSTSLYWSPTS